MNSILRIITMFSLVWSSVSCTNFADPNPIFEDVVESEDKEDRRFLYINIEGAVGDVVKQINPTTIARVLEHSKYSFYGVSEENSNNGTTWKSIMSGVNASRHHIAFDDFSEEHEHSGAHNANVSYPSIFYRIMTTRPHFRTFAFVSNPLLTQHVMAEAIDKKVLESDEDIKNYAVEYLSDTKSKFGVISFSSVKEAGLTSGFSVDNAEYVQAINQVDAYIGEILQAIESRPDRSKEQWMIVIQSNNGGIGQEQGGATESERNIFTIYHYPTFTQTEYRKSVTSSTRFFNQTTNTNRNVVQTMDPNYLEMDGDELTAECFVWANQTVNQASNIFLLGKANGNGQNDANRRGWFFAFRQNTIMFHATVGTSKHMFLSGASTLGKQWSHFAATIKREGDNYQVSFYQNGSLITTAQQTASAGERINSTQDFQIGARNSHGTVQNIDVNIKNVRVWNKALTGDEVKAHACMDEINSDLPYINTLIANYPLENNLENTVTAKPNLLSHPNFVDHFFHPVTAWNTICSEATYVPQNSDLATNVFYWLRMQNANWTLDGQLILEQFDQEFYKQ